MDFQGQTIHDGYVVAGLLGEGGDATVYRAEDRRLGRSVALKFLRPELRADPTFVARFEREARSAAQLDHPYIVPVYDYGELADTYFLVMQYLAGGDLRARLQPAAPCRCHSPCGSPPRRRKGWARPTRVASSTAT